MRHPITPDDSLRESLKGAMRVRRFRNAVALAALATALILTACVPIGPVDHIGEAAAPAQISPSAKPSVSSSLDTSKYENVWVKAIEEVENDGRSLLRVSYPFTEHEKINARMEAVTQAFVDEYRRTAAEIEASYQEYKAETGKEAATFITHFRQHFDVSAADESLIFFDLLRSISMGGTGNAYVVGYIFDRRSGAELALSDLFVDESYLGRLSDLTREALAKRVSEEELASNLDWVEDGTAPTAVNFDNILIRPDGTFLVRFDKYQVAAGVEGIVEVALPLADIADLLKPEARKLLGIEREAEESGTGPIDTDATRREAGVVLAFDGARSLANSVGGSTALPTGLSLIRPVGGLLQLFGAGLQESSLSDESVNCQEVACVALTFDDGPSFYTDGLLDTLKEHDVRATFFVLGTQVRIQSETVARMFREGHQIGNHTWDHPNLTNIPDEQIQEQLRLTDDLIVQLVGETTPFMRPPYGAYNDRVLAASGLPIIFWSVDPLDWRDRDAAIVAARIMEAPVGAIILAHDIHRSTVDAVPAIINALRGRGIQFVTVTKLFEPQELHAQNVYMRQPELPSEQ